VDPVKAMERLEAHEKRWGGTPQERQKTQMNAYRIAKGLAPAILPPDAAGNAAQATGTAGEAARSATPAVSAPAPAPAPAPGAPPPTPASGDSAQGQAE
ncbi:MAG: hypothetical protein B7Z20_09970, partial [Sphingobium sp. 32-64-5]